MKKILSLSLITSMLFASLLFATEHADLEGYAACNYCGMNRAKFAHSRMLIEYEKGSPVATCSLHCAAIDLALSIDKTPMAIRVGDFNSKQLIDAEKAFWVLGGEKPGVMTMRGKWAFSDKAAAEQFVGDNGGTIVNFNQAMKAAYEDMHKDTMMIREKRKMKRMKMPQMGKK